MRGYIFTENERKILRKWIEEGLKLEGFAVLTHRVKQSAKRLRDDYKLLEEALKKLEGDENG
jgi:cAMP phosphodiesterase